MEGHFKTERNAGLRLGGLPDEERRQTPYSVTIPGALSFLAHGSFDAEVKGLEEFPKGDWPPVAVVHVSFQIMVATGIVMMAIALSGAWLTWRRVAGFAGSRVFLKTLVVASPIGFIAIEAGWIVTEVGRQPWIIQGVLRTANAVTSMPNLIVTLFIYVAIYILLGFIVIVLLYRQIRDTRDLQLDTPPFPPRGERALP
jgi:cytochrome bd ubiquinol oxidase subunit I